MEAERALALGMAEGCVVEELLAIKDADEVVSFGTGQRCYADEATLAQPPVLWSMAKVSGWEDGLKGCRRCIAPATA